MHIWTSWNFCEFSSLEENWNYFNRILFARKSEFTVKRPNFGGWPACLNINEMSCHLGYMDNSWAEPFRLGPKKSWNFFSRSLLHIYITPSNDKFIAMIFSNTTFWHLTFSWSRHFRKLASAFDTQEVPAWIKEVYNCSYRVNIQLTLHYSS